MALQKKVLFLTNSEYGEANVMLATAYELMCQNCIVHLASHSPLESRVRKLNNGDFGPIPVSTTPATFHLFTGESNHERRMTKFNIPSIDHRPTVKDAIRMYGVLSILAGSQTGEEYVQAVQECNNIIVGVNADIVVVGNYFLPGIDSCRVLDRRYAILSPNTFREITSDEQSLLGAMVKYPALVTFSFRKPTKFGSQLTEI
jgi:hypothetical protein